MAQVKTDDDRYKYLSIDNLTFDQQKVDVDFKNHNKSYKFFSQLRRAITSIYNMAVYTQGTNRNAVYTVVCCIPVTFVSV